MLLCPKCGRAMCHDGKVCATCRVGADAPVALTVPYSFKLLLQEMSAMGIDWQVDL